MLSLVSKVAVVTGAGSVGPGWGNGKATATLLARQGAKIFAIDYRLDAAQETQGIIQGEGGTCVVHQCNMTDSASVKEAVEACLATFGRIDIWINNVGGSAPGNPVTMTEEVWHSQIDHNLNTTFLGCKHVLPVMEAQGKGAIVNISSVAAVRDHVGRTHVGYSATKAAVIALGHSTALAFAKKGIRVNTVLPGLMHTPLVEARLTRQLGVNDAAALIADRHSRVPMGHMGDAWDVAHAVLFLASDEARFITGTEIVVDGGMIQSTP
ncbi:MAG: SDR family oxidoreductase [Acetobacteraceae bacterium]|nr:SDR family oxidoreductase [Acetobacteraceae bacterium]